jgi:hypothetical protein
MIKIYARIYLTLVLSFTSIIATAANSYMLEIVCQREPNVTYNRSFWANDDMDAQNKARAILSSAEFQSKGGCSIKSLKKG